VIRETAAAAAAAVAAAAAAAAAAALVALVAGPKRKAKNKVSSASAVMRNYCGSSAWHGFCAAVKCPVYETNADSFAMTYGVSLLLFGDFVLHKVRGHNDFSAVFFRMFNEPFK